MTKSTRRLMCALVGCLTISAPFALASPALAEDSVDEVVDGVVIGGDGKAVKGATVALVVEPTSAELDALKIGETVVTPIVGTDVTDSSGNYSLDISDMGAVDEHADRSGKTNFKVQVLSPNAPAAFFLPLDVEASLPAQASTLRAVQARSAQTVNITYAAARKGAPPSSKTPTRVAAAEVTTAAACGNTLIEDYGLRRTTLERYYSRANNVQAKFSVTAIATMKFGVGVSASGTKGTFKASGTQTVERSSGISESTQTQSGDFNTAANADIRFKKFSGWCGDAQSGSRQFYVRGTSYGSSLSAGALSSAPTFPTADSYCIHKPAGTAWSMERSTASTYEGGVNIDAIIGIDLSSQSGYTSNEKLTMNFSSAGGGRICGQKAHPSETPGILVARDPL